MKILNDLVKGDLLYICSKETFRMVEVYDIRSENDEKIILWNNDGWCGKRLRIKHMQTESYVHKVHIISTNLDHVKQWLYQQSFDITNLLDHLYKLENV